jgi:Domain of unknown function (DUF4260)
MFTRPRILLHIEGGVVLFLSVLFYAYLRASWPLFFLLILAPDLFMLGYLVNVRVGTLIYNSVHTYVGPLLLVAISASGIHAELLPYALIWTAHLGMDRMLGFGLKYATTFKDTHLQHV